MLAIDYSVSVGNLITIVCMAGTAVVFFERMKGDILTLKKDFDSITANVSALAGSVKGFSTVLTTIALQGSRLETMDKAIDELRHGEGLIGVRMTKDGVKH